MSDMTGSYYARSHTLWRRLARAKALETHFDMGLEAYERGEREGLVRHMEAVAVLPEGGTGCIEYLALSWRLKWLDGDQQAAAETARLGTLLFPQDVDTVLEYGRLLVDLGRHGDALPVLEEGTRLAPEDADMWFELGVAAEFVEDWDLRIDAFRRVWQIEHRFEPAEARLLTDDEAVAVAEAAVERLPPAVRSAVGNVAIIVEDYPEEWVVTDAAADPRILGLFDGPTHGFETSLDAVMDGPARIYLFRRNIERHCQDREDAEHQIALTVLHELGHYFGFDEVQLEDLGLN
jgi:predicted Zn-dependent protease with MMP-like domain